MYSTKLFDFIREPKPDISLDAPEATIFHRELILGKPFLKKLYEDWYGMLIDASKTLPAGFLLEIGSGGGFLKNVLPQVLTSDIIPLPYCDYTCSADKLPFENETVAGLFMVDVLHHIPNVKDFFKEAQRVLKPEGKIMMIEPANTLFSRFIYENLHHEDFMPELNHWHFDSSGALSGANGALPWMIFSRDRSTFEEQFPDFAVQHIDLHTPFRYLISGGLSYRSILPGAAHNIIRWSERLLKPLNPYFAMFQTIHVKKKG